MRRLLAIAALAVSLPTAVAADPVEVSEEHSVELGKVACSIWVEPAGDEYEWTFVCGAEVDSDGDGDVDSRTGSVYRSFCQEDDPEQGSFCSGSEPIADGDLTAGEFAMDLAGGTGMLHADLGTCRVDIDWTATEPAQSQSGSEIPDLWPGLDPPMISLNVRSGEFSYAYRRASMSGAVCAAAEVSGPPRVSFLLDYEDTERVQSVQVDPTA